MRKRLLNYAAAGLFSISVLLMGSASPSWAGGPIPLIPPSGTSPRQVCNGYPLKINNPGSYRLLGNLILPDGCGKDAILVNADAVTLDLGGNVLEGIRDPEACNNGTDEVQDVRGIHADGKKDVVIFNGIVEHFGDGGISAGARCKVEEVRAVENCGEGIICSEASLILHNIVSGNTGKGIECEDGCKVFNNVVEGNLQGGLEFATCIGPETETCPEEDDPTVGYGDNVLHNNGSPSIQGGTSMGGNVVNGAPAK